MLELVKSVHITCAILTIISFSVRITWLWSGSDLLHKKTVKIAPHVIDSFLFLSGIILVINYYSHFYQHNWLLVKLTAIIFYIITGSIALKYGKTLLIRIYASIISLVLLAVIVLLAVTRQTNFISI